MSDDKLSVIPSNPHWQPGQDAADRAAAVLTEFATGSGDTGEVEVMWYDTATFVDCGANLDRIECPRCDAPLDIGWWADRMGTHGESGFADLTVTVPCCGAHTSLNVLNYDWPCGSLSLRSLSGTRSGTGSVRGNSLWSLRRWGSLCAKSRRMSEPAVQARCVNASTA
ncbi:hypothetical protein [Streptomyces sp. NRRL B-1347]|uniref:hypothetical protein n=1 Tax=Streptomyces sp. NRRL B-1347 TaxID=1476877 RepID=UPI001F3D2302|nr:hypothetical protein [Streptomyces sp. NRRL B-1347]